MLSFVFLVCDYLCNMILSSNRLSTYNPSNSTIRQIKFYLSLYVCVSNRKIVSYQFLNILLQRDCQFKEVRFEMILRRIAIRSFRKDSYDSQYNKDQVFCHLLCSPHIDFLIVLSQSFDRVQSEFMALMGHQCSELKL